MTLRFDIRRFMQVALALAVAFAVVGLACLVPVSAMASTSHEMDQPSKGCDDTGSVQVCPHESESVAVAVSALSEHAKVSFALLPAESLGVVAQSDAATALSIADPPDSGSPLTVPLRL